MLMTRFLTAVSTYADQLEPGLDDLFSNLKNNYQLARTAQLGKKGAVGDLRDNSAAVRDALEIQLTKSLHFIAYKYPGDVEQCMAYFDQSFLRDKADESPAPGGGGEPGGEPGGNPNS
jgi:hypothetical protein